MSYSNTKKQGDAGLGQAIAFYTLRGQTVLLPLTDSQQYDLVIDDGQRLYRVQVKTTSYKRYGNFMVSLSIKGGNQSFSSIKDFDKSSVDLIFVATSDGEHYSIPVDSITAKNSISLNKTFDEFKSPSSAIW